MPACDRLHGAGVWAAAAAAATAALLWCAPSRAQPASPAAKAPAEVGRNSGEYLYLRHCSDCHGRDGRGTVIGFPLIGRPAGVISPEHVIEVLRQPLQMMPAFPSGIVSDDMAKLIAHYIAVLDNRATGAPIPPPPDIAAQAPRGADQLPTAPVVRPADPKTYELREFESPCGAGYGAAIAADGRIWYAGAEQQNLAMFDPATEKFACWKIPTRNARPYGIGVDDDGLVWITLTGLPDNKIAMFDPTTELFTEYYLPQKPQPFPYPYTLAFDADDNVVFSLAFGDGIGRIKRSTGRFDILPLPARNARPTGIDIAKNGHAWVAESIGNRIADIDLKSGRVTEYPHPRATEDDPGLGRLALDTKGNVWVGESETGSVAMFDPRTKRWKSWRAPANGGRASGLSAIALDDRDTVWFSHGGGNYIGRFDPKTERFSVYPQLTANMNCMALDIAADGSLWCMGSGAPKLVHLMLKRAGN